MRIAIVVMLSIAVGHAAHAASARETILRRTDQIRAQAAQRVKQDRAQNLVLKRMLTVLKGNLVRKATLLSVNDDAHAIATLMAAEGFRKNDGILIEEGFGSHSSGSLVLTPSGPRIVEAGEGQTFFPRTTGGFLGRAFTSYSESAGFSRMRPVTSEALKSLGLTTEEAVQRSFAAAAKRVADGTYKVVRSYDERTPYGRLFNVRD